MVSKGSLTWAAKKRIPYVMLATKLEPTQKAFGFYDEIATQEGYTSGPQNRAYLWKVHVDETEELADQVARKYIQGPSNPWLVTREHKIPVL